MDISDSEKPKPGKSQTATDILRMLGDKGKVYSFTADELEVLAKTPYGKIPLAELDPDQLMQVFREIQTVLPETRLWKRINATPLKSKFYPPRIK